MDKNDEIIINNSHSVNLNDRKKLVISGVKKIGNFDNEEFSLETIMGLLIIKGEKLELIKLDTIQGNVSIKGKIDIIEYKDDLKNKNTQGIFNRLFK